MKRVFGCVAFLLLTFNIKAQNDVCIVGGLNAWKISHNSPTLSQPYSFNYTTGFHIEHTFSPKGFGILTGFEYTFSPPGVLYADPSGGEIATVATYENEINRKYINVKHHELSIPVMGLFYCGILRSGAGLEFNRYLFPDINNDGVYGRNDWGFRLQSGIRINPKPSISVAYFQALNPAVKFKGSILDLN